mgnify:CR=1 FL=1|tara:strand:+ start:287 stop:1525 length:1239 start_codon:yes stop_codon:yes gene_type:complete
MYSSYSRYSLCAVLVLSLLVLLGCKPERPKIPANERGQMTRSQPTKDQNTARKRQILQPLVLPKEARGIVLAKGENLTITAGDFVDALLDQPLSLRVRYQNPDRWKEFLMDMIAFELMGRNATEMGLNRDEALLHSYKKTVFDQHLRVLSERAVSPSDILDAEIDRAYEERPSITVEPASAKVYVYESRDFNQAKATLAYLLAVDTEYADSSDEERAAIRLERFRERVRELGDDFKFAESDGDAGYIGEDGTSTSLASDRQVIPPVVAKQIFEEQRAGAIYYNKEENAPYRRIGFLIVGVESVSPSKQISKEDARTKIRNLLLAERRNLRQNEIKKELLEGTQMQVDEAAFKKAFGSVNPTPKSKPKPKPKLTPIRPSSRPTIGVKHRTDLKQLEKLIDDNPRNAVRKGQPQ